MISFCILDCGTLDRSQKQEAGQQGEEYVGVYEGRWGDGGDGGCIIIEGDGGDVKITGGGNGKRQGGGQTG